MPLFRIKLQKIKRRRRYIPLSGKTPIISHIATVDIGVQILDPMVGTITISATDLAFQIFTPTLTFAPYVISAPVIDIGFEIVQPIIVRNIDVTDVVFDVNEVTTFYPILLPVDVVDIVFQINDFSKTVVPVVTDIVFDISAVNTSLLTVTPTTIDLGFQVYDSVSVISGFFFCVDAGFIYEPGCEEGLIVDGIVQAGKINCGE